MKVNKDVGVDGKSLLHERHAGTKEVRLFCHVALCKCARVNISAPSISLSASDLLPGEYPVRCRRDNVQSFFSLSVAGMETAVIESTA